MNLLEFRKEDPITKNSQNIFHLLAKSNQHDMIKVSIKTGNIEYIILYCW